MKMEEIRKDFPVLQKRIAYLDSACMALKPVQVVEAMNRYYLEFPACGERSKHSLGRIVTEEYDNSRKKITKFIGAKDNELIFTKNTTEGLNLAANSLNLGPHDVVITTDKEHNSNFLPWRKFQHKVLDTDDGLDLDKLNEMMNKNVKIVAAVHTSNIDGVTFPIKEMAKIAHDNDALMVVDGAQSAPHRSVDMKKLGCDMFAFSGHKMLGPSIGCLYIRSGLELKPFLVGGGTVSDVVDGVPRYLEAPEVFEAGLQNYAGAMGLAAAVDYLQRVGLNNIEKHEAGLNKMITEGIENLPGVTILGGPPEERGGIVSFTIKGLDPKDAAIMLDSYGILVRGGFHCCHNWFNARGIDGSIRASLYLYNNEHDTEMFANAMKKIVLLAKH
jgi:cysteine desulfurase / selenocysteine lyase